MSDSNTLHTFTPTNALTLNSAERDALQELAEWLHDASVDQARVRAEISAVLTLDRKVVAEETSTKIEEYFLRLATLSFEDYSTVSYREAWRDLTRRDVDPSALMRPFMWASEQLFAYARQAFSDRSAAYETAQQALNKLSFFHLGAVFELMHQARNKMLGVFSLHHATTKLPNRILLLDLLHDLIGRGNSDETKLATLLIDIQFSAIVLNSVTSITHDDLILECAERLQSVLREDDVLGQSAHSQFCLILPRLKVEGQALLAANKVLRLLEIPIARSNVEVPIRATIGAAISPHHGRTAEQLLQRAELAKREALSRGEQIMVYEEAFGEEELGQRILEEKFALALHENEFMVYLQPQLDLRTGKIESAEALLRWRTPDQKFIPPNVAVAIAERTGQIGRLSSWMMNAALRHAAEFSKAGFDINIAVNLTAMNLADRELPDFVDQALRTWGVSPRLLTIEITEGSMLSDTEHTIQILDRLKAIGVELSIDDFGTGYSSLSYLKRLPVDELKIDQVFVRNMLSVKQDEQIVRTVIDLAHNFDLTVIAEGVEEDETTQILRKLGCDKIQGYVLARPMPASELVSWLRKHAEDNK